MTTENTTPCDNCAEIGATYSDTYEQTICDRCRRSYERDSMGQSTDGMVVATYRRFGGSDRLQNQIAELEAAIEQNRADISELNRQIRNLEARC